MNKGFTLIELLVVIAIISIMSALVLPNLGFSEKQFSVVTSAYKLAQDMRRVQEMGMSSIEFNGSIPLGGYGIRVLNSSNSYILFADVDNDHIYDSNEKIEEVSLDGQAIFQTSATVIFAPPDPIIYGAPVSIVIRDTSDLGLSSKTVKINIIGLISIE
jgi:prepilin-type N-terminal cleavage/methylation domain-containing protein